ncbi:MULTISPECIES: hypothetical protein [Microvirga]|uniref:hypothetical protein n=1 Tax=Microvirga TaxID=186650 RepID=UPI0021C6F519|nr:MULTISPECIES: hypothetical protein [unclassified Microvirga]
MLHAIAFFCPPLALVLAHKWGPALGNALLYGVSWLLVLPIISMFSGLVDSLAGMLFVSVALIMFLPFVLLIGLLFMGGFLATVGVVGLVAFVCWLASILHAWKVLSRISRERHERELIETIRSLKAGGI